MDDALLPQLRQYVDGKMTLAEFGTWMKKYNVGKEESLFEYETHMVNSWFQLWKLWQNGWLDENAFYKRAAEYLYWYEEFMVL